MDFHERVVYIAYREDDPVYQNLTILGVYTRREDAENTIALLEHEARIAGERLEADDPDDWDVSFGIEASLLFEPLNENRHAR